jgi:hypothetical protein
MPNMNKNHQTDIHKMNAAQPVARDIADYRDTWRVFRIMAELVEGYQFLTKFHREITILGSARFPEENRYYALARETGFLLGKDGYTVITGGGPGIMEAANRGAYEAGGESVGLNIQLPFDQRINPYVKKSTAFYYFFTRKVMLTAPADAFVLFPGGFGTMDEFFEIVDHMDLGVMTRVPIVLVGRDYWAPLIAFLEKSACAIGAVKEDMIRSWHVVDTAAEAITAVKSKKGSRDICDIDSNSFYCAGGIDWKIFRVMAELVEGFEFLTGLTHAVTISGTKSIPSGHRYYEAAWELGRMAAERGLTVVTGSKFGIAEAANKGAYEAGGRSVGIGMRVGSATEVNAYMDKFIQFQFPFTRKLMITAPTKAFVFFPGGFGTLHQLFEILTLIQTKKIKKRPVVLVDHAYWGPLHAFIKEVLVHRVGTIDDRDDELYQIVDDSASAMRLIENIV